MKCLNKYSNLQTVEIALMLIWPLLMITFGKRLRACLAAAIDHFVQDKMFS